MSSNNFLASRRSRHRRRRQLRQQLCPILAHLTRNRYTTGGVTERIRSHFDMPEVVSAVTAQLPGIDESFVEKELASLQAQGFQPWQAVKHIVDVLNCPRKNNTKQLRELSEKEHSECGCCQKNISRDETVECFNGHSHCWMCYQAYVYNHLKNCEDKEYQDAVRCFADPNCRKTFLADDLRRCYRAAANLPADHGPVA